MLRLCVRSTVINFEYQYLIFICLAGGCDDLPELPTKFIAAALILIVIFINCSSVKATSKLISFFGFGKIISLCIVIVAGMVRLGQGNTG